MPPPDSPIPAGFQRLTLSKSLFLETNGPFYGRRADGGFTIGLPVEERHCNSNGTLHGGMTLAFADVALTVGGNILARTQRFLPTLSVTCDFVGAAKAGDWVQAPVEILRVTKSFVFAQALISTQEGAPIARISGNLLIRGEPDPKFDAERYFR